jgi:hypothetical protein
MGFVDGRAILCYGDDNARQTRVSAWNLTTGELEVLHESEMYVTADGRPSMRGAVLVPGDSARFLTFPTFSENYDKEQAGASDYAVRLIDLDRDTEREFQLRPTPSVTAAPSIDPEGGLMIMSDMLKGVQAYELETGAHAGTLRVHPRLGLWDVPPVVCVPRRWFVVVTLEDMAIRDMDRKAWIATLSYPHMLVRPEPYLSRDGLSLAAVGFRRQGRGTPPAGGNPHELLIYDLSPLADDAPSAPGAPSDD